MRDQRQYTATKRSALSSTPPSLVDRIPMQAAPDNTFLERSEDHQNVPHINTLVTLVLEKNGHRRSDSTVAIAPSVMDDSSSTVFVEGETGTNERPSVEEEGAEELAVAHRDDQPQSDAQRLAADVRSKMEEEEPLRESWSAQSEDRGHGQSPSPSYTDDQDLSMNPSDLQYVDFIMYNTLTMEPAAQSRKRPSLKSSIRKLSFLNLHRKKGSER